MHQPKIKMIKMCLNETYNKVRIGKHFLGYRSWGPGSIPGTTRFSGKKKRKENSSGSGTGSTQPRGTTEELLDRKVVAPV
jgi:hypothetical protein